MVHHLPQQLATTAAGVHARPHRLAATWTAPLATEKTYRDFHLSLRFKCEASGNIGVYLHTEFEPGTAMVIKGRQIEIDRTIGHHTGGIYGDG